MLLRHSKIQILYCTFSLMAILGACEPTVIEKKPAGAYVLPTTPNYFGSYNLPADNPLTYEGIDLGRKLFYEKQLSADNSIACGSCHQQRLAFTDGLPVSVGVGGQKRDVGSMSLANLLWQRKFNWTGNAASLEQQVLLPMQHPAEMNQPLATTIAKLQKTSTYPQKFQQAFGSSTITTENIAKALAQFLRTLVSADSKFDKYQRGEAQLTVSEQRGFALFAQHPYPEQKLRGGNCGDCHTGFLQAGSRIAFEGFHNNGLDTDTTLKQGLAAFTNNAADKGKFKAPSLRNIALTAPYMHDGRFATLAQVLDHYNEHIRLSSTLDPLVLGASNHLFMPPNEVKLGLTTQEKQDIIAFLNTLTDEKFINNKEFASPF
jgi:cytochrome c peroxidase